MKTTSILFAAALAIVSVSAAPTAEPDYALPLQRAVDAATAALNEVSKRNADANPIPEACYADGAVCNVARQAEGELRNAINLANNFLQTPDEQFEKRKWAPKLFTCGATGEPCLKEKRWNPEWYGCGGAGEPCFKTKREMKERGWDPHWYGCGGAGEPCFKVKKAVQAIDEAFNATVPVTADADDLEKRGWNPEWWGCGGAGEPCFKVKREMTERGWDPKWWGCGAAGEPCLRARGFSPKLFTCGATGEPCLKAKRAAEHLKRAADDVADFLSAYEQNASESS